MTTTNKTRAIVGTLLASAASVAGMVAIAAPAQAADQYIALALGYINENPPVTMSGGSAITGTEESAGQGAITNCANNGGGSCTTMVIAKNACAAAAANNYGERKGAIGATVADASRLAVGQLPSDTGAKVIVSGCANGYTPPPPPNDRPPPAPKLGPTVSFNKVLGGLESHITDRSGVTSQCTYATDDYSRSFGLPANSTYDLRIVPAVPRFKNWTVTVTCDNGTSTTATTYF